jgi:hypothetical protein
MTNGLIMKKPAKKASLLLYVVFACLILVAAFACAGCKKTAAIDNSPKAETFRIDNSCNDPESCCIEKCTSYCTSQGGKYSNHGINGQTCFCYCDAA